MTQQKIDLAQDQDFKEWIDNNVYHLVNQVMDIWYQDDTQEPHEKLWIATKNAITSEDIEDFRQGYDPEDLPDMEDPEFEDAIIFASVPFLLLTDLNCGNFL